MTALRYRAVLFDLDGTLVDSYPALADAVNHARRQEGLSELDVDEVRRMVGHGAPRLLQRAFGVQEVPHPIRAAFERRYGEVCCDLSTTLSEVETTLETLQRLGVEMAVCTNKPAGFSNTILEALGLAHHFRAVVGGDQVPHCKPDGGHLLAALAFTGVAAADALYVGDMPIDVETARNAGVDVAVVATGSSTIEELRAAHADFELSHFSELAELVMSTDAVARTGRA